MERGGHDRRQPVVAWRRFRVLQGDGLHTKAYLGWDPIVGAIDSSYTVRYRELPGEHWKTEWELPDGAGDWTTDQVRVSTTGSGDQLASISGIGRTGSLYAVHVNYETASGKVFSARDAYFWTSTVKPDLVDDSRERVATFPYYGHFEDAVFAYRICEFPPEIQDVPGSTGKWRETIQDGIRTWEVATGGRVRTQYSGSCVKPDWSSYENPQDFFCGPFSLLPTWSACALAVKVNDLPYGDISLLEGLSRARQGQDALQGQENVESEVRIFDKADHDDAEFITRIYDLCTLSNATGCTTSDAYGKDRGGEPATTADIYLNWDRLTDVSHGRVSYDAGTLNPGMENIQFNQCHSPPEIPLDSRAFELVIHEAGHALGMSGASQLRSFAQFTIDAIGRLPFLDDLIKRFGDGLDLDHETSHPTVVSTVLNYASDEKRHGVEGEPDCFPHPLDVLAINALYQDGYEQPVFGPFWLSTSTSGGAGSVTMEPARPAGGYYDDGTMVTVTATWDPLILAFERWEGDCAHELTPICIVTMDDDKSVRANFSTTEADEAPSFGSASFTLTRAPGAMFHFIPLPTATGGNGTLSYSLSSSNQPDWLVFAPAPPTISTKNKNPIPASAAGINYTMTLTVVDSDSNTGSSDRDSVTINVTVSPISGSFSVEGEVRPRSGRRLRLV